MCPWNARFAEETTEPGYAARGPGELPSGVEELPGERGAEAGRSVSAETRGRSDAHPGTASPSLVELLRAALNPDAWDAFSRGAAIRRAGRAGFARNVCVGLGNWGSPEAIPVLATALSDREPLVRRHAAWALGRISGERAGGILRSALDAEQDQSVREELEGALHPTGEDA